jgi:hypothetical protein
MTVSGKIRGKVRPGGSIEVSAQSEQAMELGGSRGPALGDKSFVAAAGETTAIEFPQKAGYEDRA